MTNEIDWRNCALGTRCTCRSMGVATWWKCKNWGRSSLSAPNIHSAYKEPLGKTRDHNKQMNERLGNMRHSPRGRGR